MDRRRSSGTVRRTPQDVFLSLFETISASDRPRYVWDARVAGAGLDPYMYSPTDLELAGLRDSSTYPQLNHKTWRTVYPPASEAIFGAVYRSARRKRPRYAGLRALRA